MSRRTPKVKTPSYLARQNRRQRILIALKAGPMTAEQLAAAADTAYASIAEVLRPLLAQRLIVLLGRARELGIKSRMDARVYALPGTRKPEPHSEETKAKLAGPYAIAGRITHGRGSKWGAGA